jgi:IS30 family transposase
MESRTNFWSSPIGKKYISHERMYQQIWDDKKAGGALYKDLRHAGKKYNKRSSGKAGRGCIPNRIDMKNRPAVVEEKSRIGDWKGDLIVGAEHQGALLSYVDRHSKCTKMAKLPNKNCRSILSRDRKNARKIGVLRPA